LGQKHLFCKSRVGVLLNKGRCHSGSCRGDMRKVIIGALKAQNDGNLKTNMGENGRTTLSELTVKVKVGNVERPGHHRDGPRHSRKNCHHMTLPFARLVQ
jgi:hypothetical protein